jgi:DNA-binding MarR family transcriptional regulator
MSDELTASALRAALAEAVGDNPDSKVVEDLMRALDKKKLFRYKNDDEINLLSTHGRVLMAIMQDPTLTQRAISVYLGCSETLVDKSVKTLVDKGLITKTKLNRQNVYRLNPKIIDSQSDIRHLRDAINLLNGLLEAKNGGKAEQPKAQPPRRLPSGVGRVVEQEPF